MSRDRGVGFERQNGEFNHHLVFYLSSKWVVCYNITEEVNGTSIGPGRPFTTLTQFPMDFPCASLVLLLFFVTDVCIIIYN